MHHLWIVLVIMQIKSIPFNHWNQEQKEDSFIQKKTPRTPYRGIVLKADNSLSTLTNLTGQVDRTIWIR